MREIVTRIKLSLSTICSGYAEVYIPKIGSFCDSKKLIRIIILLGIAVRLSHYLPNHSLRIDESALSLNIVNCSSSGFLEPMEYDQMAPFGYLWLSKLTVDIFGNHEYSLRFLSIVAGGTSLFLFYKLSPRELDHRGVLVAMNFFATGAGTIRKQLSDRSGTTSLCFKIVLLGTPTADLLQTATRGSS